MIDTGAVRLVILVTMFLYFAGEHYTSLVSTIWGNENMNRSNALKGMPTGPPREGLNQIFVNEPKPEEENGREMRD